MSKIFTQHFPLTKFGVCRPEGNENIGFNPIFFIIVSWCWASMPNLQVTIYLKGTFECMYLNPLVHNFLLEVQTTPLST